MHITQHRMVTDGRLLARLWELYEQTMASAATEDASLEMLYWHEFDQYLRDGRHRLWVLHNDVQPVAMCLVDVDYSAANHLSPAYFERCFPDHAERSAVHSLCWLVAHPMYETHGAVVRLGRAVLEMAMAERALVLFNEPFESSSSVAGLSEMMNELARLVGSPAISQKIEVQRYFAIDFAQSAIEDDRLSQPVSTFR